MSLEGTLLWRKKGDWGNTLGLHVAPSLFRVNCKCTIWNGPKAECAGGVRNESEMGGCSVSPPVWAHPYAYLYSSFPSDFTSEVVCIVSYLAGFGWSTYDGLIQWAVSLNYLRKCVDSMAEGRGKVDKGKVAVSRRQEAMWLNQVKYHVWWLILRLAPLLALQYNSLIWQGASVDYSGNGIDVMAIRVQGGE